MSMSQDELTSPVRSILGQKRRNKISSPSDRSPVSNPGGKGDVFELFTVKTPTRVKSKILTSDSQDTSELSDDVFVKPKPVTVSTPSTKSYRDKINERFHKIKEKAGKSTKKANVFKEVTEKILLEKVRRESEDVDAELELMRSKLKLGKRPENREKFDFFCAEKSREHDGDEVGDNFQSTEALTDEKVDMDFTLPKQMKAEMNKAEQSLLFKPKSQPVDISDKLQNEEPRYLEEEGFYISPRPKIPIKHEYLLEQRLSCDHKKWFNCEGKLNILENPIQKTSFRPQLKPLPPGETFSYLPAAIENAECEEILVVRENLLHLQIYSLKFAHHPLFSLEHVLEQKLRRLHKEYEDSISTNKLMRIKGRLDGLRQLLKRSEDASSYSGDYSDKEEAYRRDIKTLQQQVFEEGKKEKDRIKAILTTWKAIKRIREANKYSNTSTKLLIRKEKVDYETDKDNFESMFEDVYAEILEEKSKRKRRDKDDIKEDLLERFKESYRMPGEPVLHFALTSDNEITKSLDNVREITRRSVVGSTKIALKIVCNKMEVCKTKAVSLQDDFACNFDEAISIQLVNIPKFITIEIIEQPKSLIKRTVGELTIKLPPKSSAKSYRNRAFFEKNEVVHYKHEGVGSGMQIEDLGDELNTCGFLKYSIKWNSPTYNEETNSESRQIIDEIIDKNGAIDLAKLTEWMNQHKPDPQDPRNSILYEYSFDCDDQDIASMGEKANFFRLNPYMKSWQFCDPKVLEDNRRLQVLQLRNRNEPEFDRMVVPNRIKEIPLDILADYKRRVAAERENLLAEEDDDDDDEIVKRRSRGKKQLRQIHTKVFQRCKNSQNNLTYEDILDQKFLHQFQRMIKAWITSFLMWFQWRPQPLFIQIKQPSQESKLYDFKLENQAKVVITVISGLNLPERSEDKSEICPFVEAQYNNTMARSSTSHGSHPSWNEKLILPLHSSHSDYLNPNSLNGTVTLHIFDENDKMLTKFPGEKSRNWLGSISIALSAICFEGIQGMFKVKTPHVLLGYKDTTKKQANQLAYLNLNVTIEPNIPKLNPNIAELPCGDVPYIKEHALRWNEEYNMNFPHRKFSVLAIDANATTTCVVRYIKPLEPPQINVEGFAVTPEQCARFISLIPFTDCNQFYRNIWLPTDRFLHFMIGSVIDHAVALTCYLLALRIEAWLLLGFGIPHGSTAFVLVKEYDNNQTPVFYVYDVAEGEKIYFTDAFCPVQKIYCVINEQNVWANTQRSDDVAVTRFDFSRRSDWLPLFDAKISPPTNSIHGKIAYLPQADVDELEIIIDRKIRKQIAKLRKLDRTLWNHQVSNASKSALNSFEKTEMYGQSNSEPWDKIKEMAAVYKIRGHVIHLPFNDVSSIIKRVKSYGLHLEEEDVQFASAVSLRSYPNQVLTVWIFLASVMQRKEINET